MRNLLDTHTLIWFVNGDSQLSNIAKKAIEESDAVNYVSIASLWEIAIKVSLGKLQLKTPFQNVSQQIEENGFRVLPITFSDTARLLNLPFLHKDPFDRIIICQSINNNLTLLSKDGQFSVYGIASIW
jgi:PIN domain nuclease of toxin-antitoxin system